MDATARPLDQGPGFGMPVDVWAALDERLDPGRWRPQLAGDIETAELSVSGGEPYTILANPRDLLHYRLTAAEARLLPLLNGRRTIGEILVHSLGHGEELDAPSL